MTRGPPRKNQKPNSNFRSLTDPKNLAEAKELYKSLEKQNYKPWTIYRIMADRFGYKFSSSIRHNLEPGVRATENAIRSKYPRHSGTESERATNRDYQYLKRNLPDLVQKAFAGVDSPLDPGELSDRLVQVLADAGRPNLHYLRCRTIELLVNKYELTTGTKLLKRVGDKYRYR